MNPFDHSFLPPFLFLSPSKLEAHFPIRLASAEFLRPHFALKSDCQHEESGAAQLWLSFICCILCCRITGE